MELATKKTLPDTLDWVKVSGVAWQGDGFYYSRYPEPAKGKSEKAAINEDHQVYFHKVGTPQSQDGSLPGRGQPAALPHRRDHRRRALRAARRSPIAARARTATRSSRAISRAASASSTRSSTTSATTSYNVVDNVGDKLLVETNRERAERPGRARSIRASRTRRTGRPILPEKPEPLQGVSTAGGKLFATYLKDVTTRAYVYSLDGTLENEVELPGPGTAGGFGGNRDDTFVFYTFNSLNVPPTIYRYDIATQKSTVFRQPKVPGYNPTAYETEAGLLSRARTARKIPMFLVHKKGLKLDGTNPTLLYGYGGFNIVAVADLQRGAAGAARAGLRLRHRQPARRRRVRRGVAPAGHEAEEAERVRRLHRRGRVADREQVHVTERAGDPGRLERRPAGRRGDRTSGPTCSQVAIPQVGVMDMLRFHKFTIGWNWIADYGSSDDAEEFKALYAYSPLHNIKAGVKYPATLITTADHDDRVVPAHSFKYAATLQEKASKDTPILIRIDTKSGHGASSLTKALETTADIYAFIMHNMGLTPAPTGTRH